jgi:OOP family OmpA-OmpF porin
MRFSAAIVVLSMLAPAIAMAQSPPSTEQIVKSLTPTSPAIATRGIRLQGQPQPPSPAPSVSLSVNFATNSATLTPDDKAVLDNLGKALNDQQLAAYRFRIEGHTDTVGSRDYNKALSDRRAEAVVDYLAANFHVDRARLQAIGMGKDGLLIPTPDQTPEPRNRRVLVVNIGG